MPKLWRLLAMTNMIRIPLQTWWETLAFKPETMVTTAPWRIMHCCSLIPILKARDEDTLFRRCIFNRSCLKILSLPFPTLQVHICHCDWSNNYLDDRLNEKLYRLTYSICFLLVLLLLFWSIKSLLPDRVCCFVVWEAHLARHLCERLIYGKSMPKRR